MSDLYRQRCDSVVHDLTDNSTPEPVDPQCHDWHPDLVWYEKVEPTDRICIVHDERLGLDKDECWTRRHRMGHTSPTPCKMLDVVRIET